MFVIIDKSREYDGGPSDMNLFFKNEDYKSLYRNVYRSRAGADQVTKVINSREARELVRMEPFKVKLV